MASLFRLPELREGAALPEVRLRPTREQVLRFLEATGFQIPFFHDDEVARGMGLRGAIVPAEMKSGLLISYLRNLARPEGDLVRLQSAFRRPDYHGDRVTIVGNVTRVEASDADRKVYLELQIVQADGAVSVRSSAVVELLGVG